MSIDDAVRIAAIYDSACPSLNARQMLDHPYSLAYMATLREIQSNHELAYASLNHWIHAATNRLEDLTIINTQLKELIG